MSFRLVIIFAILSLLPTMSIALGEFHATYELAVGPLKVGEMSRTLALDADGAYEFVSTFKTTGLAALMRKESVHETSSGEIIDGKFVPDRYTYVRKSKKKPRNVNIRFDRPRSIIETVRNAEQTTSALAPGILDKLIYQATLMEDLATGLRDLEYLISDRGKEKTYRPVVEETSVIETKLGHLETLKVVRESKGGQKKTIFWCASKYGFLPVRVLHRDDGGSETVVTLVAYEDRAPL